MREKIYSKNLLGKIEYGYLTWLLIFPEDSNAKETCAAAVVVGCACSRSER